MNEIRNQLEQRLRTARRGVCIIFAALLSACASQTLFQSNFDPTPIGQPPAHTQQVGTADVSVRQAASWWSRLLCRRVADGFRSLDLTTL